ALRCPHRGAMRVGERQVRAVVADRTDRHEREDGEGNARAAGAGHTRFPEDEEVRHRATARRIRRSLQSCRALTLNSKWARSTLRGRRSMSLGSSRLSSSVDLHVHLKSSELLAMPPGDDQRKPCPPPGTVRFDVSARASITTTGA